MNISKKNLINKTSNKDDLINEVERCGNKQECEHIASENPQTNLKTGVCTKTSKTL